MWLEVASCIRGVAMISGRRGTTFRREESSSSCQRSRVPQEGGERRRQNARRVPRWLHYLIQTYARSVWEGRNFDSKHNIFYPKRVDLDSRLLDYFDGDEEAARGHAVDVVGASLGETNLFVVADVVRIEGGVRDVERYEIVPPAGAKGGDEGGLEVDSKSQRKSSYSAGAGGGLGTIDILMTELANPTKDTISQVCSWCRNGRTKEILEIIERGYDIDSRDVNGNSLLIICSQNGAANLARVLVKRGADVDGKNKLGNCALHYR